MPGLGRVDTSHTLFMALDSPKFFFQALGRGGEGMEKGVGVN